MKSEIEACLDEMLGDKSYHGIDWYETAVAKLEQMMEEAKIEMLKNMKKSLVVAHQGGFFNGSLPIQLPKDAEMQIALEAEFDRNIKELEANLRESK